MGLKIARGGAIFSKGWCRVEKVREKDMEDIGWIRWKILKDEDLPGNKGAKGHGRYEGD